MGSVHQHDQCMHNVIQEALETHFIENRQEKVFIDIFLSKNTFNILWLNFNGISPETSVTDLAFPPAHSIYGGSAEKHVLV